MTTNQRLSVLYGKVSVTPSDSHEGAFESLMSKCISEIEEAHKTSTRQAWVTVYCNDNQSLWSIRKEVYPLSVCEAVAQFIHKSPNGFKVAINREPISEVMINDELVDLKYSRKFTITITW